MALRDVPGLLAVEEVQAHRFGPYQVRHVTVGLDGTMTVAEGDRIASEVERILGARERIPSPVAKPRHDKPLFFQGRYDVFSFR